MGIHITPDNADEKMFVFDHIITFACQKGIIVPADFTLSQAVEYAKANKAKMFVPPLTRDMDYLSDYLDLEDLEDEDGDIYFADSVPQQIFVDLGNAK